MDHQGLQMDQLEQFGPQDEVEMGRSYSIHNSVRKTEEKRTKILGEGRYLLRGRRKSDKEKEEHIVRRKKNLF